MYVPGEEGSVLILLVSTCLTMVVMVLLAWLSSLLNECVFGIGM